MWQPCFSLCLYCLLLLAQGFSDKQPAGSSLLPHLCTGDKWLDVVTVSWVLSRQGHTQSISHVVRGQQKRWVSGCLGLGYGQVRHGRACELRAWVLQLQDQKTGNRKEIRMLEVRAKPQLIQ